MRREIENKLLNCKSLPEFITMFFGLGAQEKTSIFMQDVPIQRGKCFYRIRRTAGIKNPYDPKAWEPVPKEFAKQERFNEVAESVLYVASDTVALEREVNLKEGEEYYLAKYVCINDFKVGSFLGTHNQVNTLIHKIAMAVSSPEKLSDTEKSLIDDYYEVTKGKNLSGISIDMLASLYIHKMLPHLYETTNRFAKLVLQKNECGIRYSSVYTPLELSGAPNIITLDGIDSGNYMLTQKGFENIKLVSVEKKCVDKLLVLDEIISIFAEEERHRLI